MKFPDSTISMNNSRIAIAVLGTLTVALIWLFRRYLFFSHAFLFPDAGGDTITQFYPYMLENDRILRSGDFIDWSFSRGIGMSAGSPINYFNPFVVFDLLFAGNVAYKIGIEQFFKVLVTGIISFYYFKLLGLRPFAIIMGVVMITFSGYLVVGSTWYSHASNVMHFMFAIFALELFLKKDIWWVLPISLNFVVGPAGLFLIEFFVLYVILRFAHTESITWERVKLFGIRLIKPVIATLVLISSNLFYVIHKQLNSPRVGGEASLTGDLSDANPFHFAEANHYETVIYRLLNSDLLGQAEQFIGWRNYLEAPLLYCGLFTLLISAQIFRSLKPMQKWFLAGIAGFWITLIVFPYFRHAYYMFVGDYYKTAMSFFIPFTFIYFGTHAADHIVKTGRANVYILYSSLAVLLFFLYYPGFSLSSVVDGQIRTFSAIILVLFTVFLTLLAKPRWRVISVYSLGILMLAEALYFSDISLNQREALSSQYLKSRTGHNDFTLEAIQYLKSQDPSFYRVEKTFGSVKFGYNDAVAQGYFGTKSYNSANHKNYVKFLGSMEFFDPGNEIFTRWIMGLVKTTDLHPFFSIKYMISDPATDRDIDRSMYDLIGNVAQLKIYKNRYFIPFGIAYDKIMPASVFARIPGYFNKTAVLYETAVVEDRQIDQFIGLDSYTPPRAAPSLNLEDVWSRRIEKTLLISEFKQDKITGQINLEGPHMLTFTIPFDEGWKALDNGREIEIVEVNNGLSGIYLQTGIHEIELYYKIPITGSTNLIKFISIFCFLGIIAVTRKKKKSPILNISYEIPDAPSQVSGKNPETSGVPKPKRSNTSRKKRTKKRKKK